MRLRRVVAEIYETLDGEWRILRDPSFTGALWNDRIDTEGAREAIEGKRLRARWLIYKKGENDAWVLSNGEWLFATKREAVEALEAELKRPGARTA